MTERIYYVDPQCRTFTATVVRDTRIEGRPAVVLDRTAFYPTSGGQSFDTGTLGAAQVVDCVDADDDILHVLDRPLAAGEQVRGVIDWPRRVDHMQQHTGQHILSAAFERLTGNATLSVHLGAETSTIDLAAPVDAASVASAEAEANRVVFDNEHVSIRFVSQAEAARLPLRKESAREGRLRLIEIPGIDLSACGGTHVHRTGAVGLIAVTGWERLKGGSRVSFVCGGRALDSHRQLRTVVGELVQRVSVQPAELPSAVARLQAEAREQRKQLQQATERLAVHEVQGLLDGALTLGGVRVVVRALEHDAAGIKTMASALVTQPGVVAALFTSDLPAQLVVARSADVPVDAGAVLRQLVATHGGKGGGKADLAQGGGLTGDIRQIVWTASGLLEDALAGRLR